MSQKSLTFFGTSLFIFLTLFLYFYYFLPPQFLYPIKQKVSIGRWSTYVNIKYGVAIKYFKSDSLQKVSDSSIAILGGGDIKPYIIEFQKVREQSFEEWAKSQAGFVTEKEYTVMTGSRGQSLLFRDVSQTLYSMIRPGILVTIENAKSSSDQYHSQKILWEIADHIRPLFAR